LGSETHSDKGLSLASQSFGMFRVLSAEDSIEFYLDTYHYDQRLSEGYMTVMEQVRSSYNYNRPNHDLLLTFHAQFTVIQLHMDLNAFRQDAYAFTCSRAHVVLSFVWQPIWWSVKREFIS